MKINFPYENIEGFEISDDFDAKLFDLPDIKTDLCVSEIIRQALDRPIGSKGLCKLAKGKKKILIVTDDIHRPTPVF